MKHPIYEIAHITDLLKVPVDRLDDCLFDMKQIVLAMRVTAAAARAEGDDREAIHMFPKTRWIDDGSKSITVRGTDSYFTIQSVPEDKALPVTSGSKGGPKVSIDHGGVRREWPSNMDWDRPQVYVGNNPMNVSRARSVVVNRETLYKLQESLLKYAALDANVTQVTQERIEGFVLTKDEESLLDWVDMNVLEVALMRIEAISDEQPIAGSEN